MKNPPFNSLVWGSPHLTKNNKQTNKKQKKIEIFAISDAAGLRNNKFTYHDLAATFYKFPNKIT